MKDYKRLVSYIYNYENGIKRNNVGYARVESRNGNCKVTIRIKAPSINGEKVKVYFFKRDGYSIEGIFLGEMLIRNGIGYFRLVTDSNNIMDSTYEVDDIGGIVIYISSKRYYATEWDDKPVTQEMVNGSLLIPRDAKLEDEETKTLEVDNQDDEVTETLDIDSKEDDVAEVLNVESEEDEVAEELDVDSEEDDPAKASDIENEDDEVAELSDVDNDDKAKTSDIEGEDDNVTETSDIEGEDDKVTETLKTDNEEEEDIERIKTDSEEKDIAKTLNIEKEVDKTIKSTNRENQAMYDNRRKNKWRRFEEHPKAFKIYNKYPKMYPFEDNEVAWCVRIEPQDIGALPMENWALGNNSFLLHGFYCYSHLIFARINDKNGIQYILGVPGIYHNREKFMAKMFGFDFFKSIKRKELKTGEFGYWYTPIYFS